MNKNVFFHGALRKVCGLLCAWMVLFLWYPLSASAEEISLDLWHAYRDDEASALQEVVNDFEKANPGIRVSLLQVPDETFSNKVFTCFPQCSGRGAFITAHDVMGNCA